MSKVYHVVCHDCQFEELYKEEDFLTVDPKMVAKNTAELHRGRNSDHDVEFERVE